MKKENVIAKDLSDLINTLQTILEVDGNTEKWWGWDSGSLIIKIEDSTQTLLKTYCISQDESMFY